MLRNALFQVHWFVGITVGVILAVVGATGAILSFEPEILHALNRDVRVAAGVVQRPLAVPELLVRLHEAEPERRVSSLAVWSDPTRAPRVTFAVAEPVHSAPVGPRPGQSGPPPRGDVRFLDPQTGRVAESAGNRGEAFFRTTRSVHRWLTLDRVGNRDLGRQIVGAATVLLVFLAASGLYLRWPRGRTRSWRAWLTFNPRVKGRAFLWHLHAITGTWVLVFYLVMALTGLYWSYEWYKDGLYALTGAEPQRPRGEGGSTAAEPSSAMSLDRAALEAAWSSFRREVGDGRYGMAIIELPQGASPTMSIRYLDPDPPHDRAYNTVEVDTASGAVLGHRRYADKPDGDRFMASIFPLHSGRYFGLAGVVLFMIASLAMPLFAITGWMLYLARRRMKQRGQAHVPGQAGLDAPLPSRSALMESPGDA